VELLHFLKLLFGLGHPIDTNVVRISLILVRDALTEADLQRKIDSSLESAREHNAAASAQRDIFQ